MTNLPDNLKAPLIELLLSVADDKFILGHRNADWTGLAPILEEDIAFSSLAQDELAHAAALYGMIAELSGSDPNRVAYGRKPADYRCAAIVEQSDDFDWGVATVRRFICDHFEVLRLDRLARSAYKPLAALGVRLLAEERIHIGHADAWMVRLGRGNDESKGRVQAALDKLAPLAPALFEPTAGLDKLEAEAVYPAAAEDMFDTWSTALRGVVDEAGLRLALQRPAPDFVGGRQGRHSEAFEPLLDE
jgi:ring-1,2-phenylacetyl-CoA epoxidase subunit PaaC